MEVKISLNFKEPMMASSVLRDLRKKLEVADSCIVCIHVHPEIPFVPLNLRCCATVDKFKI